MGLFYVEYVKQACSNVCTETILKDDSFFKNGNDFQRVSFFTMGLFYAKYVKQACSDVCFVAFKSQRVLICLFTQE
jgi:hypothetical protein